jgi:soluble lytic murein transglycosylase-like protein
MQRLLFPLWVALFLLGAPVAAQTLPDEPLEYRAFRLTQTGPYDALIRDAAQRWAVDPFIFKGLLLTESELDPKIINKKSGAAGIGQFTASGRRGVTNIRKWRGFHRKFTLDDALNPQEAIPAAAELLAYFMGVCRTPARALMAYNSGSCRGSKGFVQVVFMRMNRLRTLAGLPPVYPSLHVPKKLLAKRTPQT